MNAFPKDLVMTTLLRLAACLMALLLGAGAAHAAGFDLITAEIGRAHV